MLPKHLNILFAYLGMTEEEVKIKIQDVLTKELGRPVAFTQLEWENAIIETLKDIRVHQQYDPEYVYRVLKTILLIVKRYEYIT